MYYPTYGDSIGASATFFIAIHKHASANHSPILCPSPPSKPPMPLASFIHVPFNTRQFATAPARGHQDFRAGDFCASHPSQGAFSREKFRPIRLYDMHRHMDEISITAGSALTNTIGASASTAI